MTILVSAVNSQVPDFSVLFQYGEVLDAVDAGLTDLEPQQYVRVVEDARSFISAHWGHPALETQCGRAWALSDLYAVVECERNLTERLSHLYRTSAYTGASAMC